MNQRSMENTSFGKWLRQRRRLLDLTQQALADEVGCARITLRRIESDALKPSKSLARILLTKLGISTTDLDMWMQFARGLSDLPDNSIDSTKQKSTNLFNAITTFLGREKELEEVTHLLSKNRLVTLTGPGGVGKTRLAQEIGRKLLPIYRDGVWMVPFESLLSPALVPQAVADTLGVREQSEISLTVLLTTFLRSKTTLLILDNCEHLLNACMEFADALLKSCPNLKILATSREILGITGEATYHVTPLSVPKNPINLQIDHLTEFGAIALFVDRATLADPDFVLTIENSSTIVEICHRLDGNPLAIELIATQVHLLQVEEIMMRLNDYFSLLSKENRLSLYRHQTLQNCIEWSWNLLNENERKLLRRLAVFSGGWTLDAAETICAGDGIAESDIFHLMGRLVKKSLVAADQKSGHATRYRLLETIREFARGKLIQENEQEYFRKQHFNYFLSLAETGRVGLRGTDDLWWIENLESEYANFRAALAWVSESGTSDPEAGLQLSGALVQFWAVHGPHSEGIHWLNEFLRKASDTPSAIRCRALCGIGGLLGTEKKSYEYLELAISIAREIAAQDLLVEALFLQAAISPFKNLGKSKEDAIECLNTAMRIEDEYHVAHAMSFIAAFIEENPSEKLRMAQKAYEIAKRLGNMRAAGYTLAGLTAAYRVCGYTTEAMASCKEWLNVNRRLGDEYWTAYASRSLGIFFQQQGDYVPARQLFEESLQIFRDMSSPVQSALTMLEMGWNEHLIGNQEYAYPLLQESLNLFIEHEQISLTTHAMNRLGHIALKQNNSPLAKSWFHKALNTLTASNNIVYTDWKIMIYILEGISGIPDLAPEKAARLLGIIDVLRLNKDLEISLLEKGSREVLLTQVISQLGQEKFKILWDESQIMSHDQIIEYACICLED